MKFSTSVESFETKDKFSGWRLNEDGKIQLTREMILNLKLANGDTLEFKFWYIKYEDSDDLILEDSDLVYYKRRWDYVSTETEGNNFYKGFHETRVHVDYNSISHREVKDSFEIISVEPAIVQGKEQSFVTIHFSGEAYNVYDPTGEHQGIYKISNGVFKRVIDQLEENFATTKLRCMATLTPASGGVLMSKHILIFKYILILFYLRTMLYL